MRWLRLINTIFFSFFRGNLSSITDESVINFRVWVTDVDLSVMNNAAMMVVLEMGRLDLIMRSGFYKLALKSKWYFPTRSFNIQFLRPLKVFQKAQLRTRVFYMDERWIYMEQKIVRGQKDIAICISKNTVKKGRETVSTAKIAKALGFSKIPTEGKNIIQMTEKGENLIYRRMTTTNDPSH
jgi:acyl-CoA thioesterase FadM